MSAMGQKQTFAVQNGMSALPPKADMCSATWRCPLSANSGHSAIHSITSSARPISVLGTLRPSALAALRLMRNSTFVPCWTGSSPAFSSLKSFRRIHPQDDSLQRCCRHNSSDRRPRRTRGFRRSLAPRGGQPMRQLFLVGDEKTSCYRSPVRPHASGPRSRRRHQTQFGPASG